MLLKLSNGLLQRWIFLEGVYYPVPHIVSFGQHDNSEELEKVSPYRWYYYKKALEVGVFGLDVMVPGAMGRDYDGSVPSAS